MRLRDILRRTPAVCLLCSATTGVSLHAEPVTVYQGICDASAAVDIGKGQFIVADDESNALTIYEYGKPAPVGRVDLGAYLAEPGAKKNKEADIEGAARVGDRIYWIASHGRDRHGNVEPFRLRLFSTRITTSGSGLNVVQNGSPPYKDLLIALAKEHRFDVLSRASTLAPEAAGGLNIEGLADTEDGGLFIGFRNPLVNGMALVLKLRNPTQVVDNGASPEFDDIIRLDLGGRGIRSLERIGDAYYLVAGPIDDGQANPAASSFLIYKWMGTTSTQPVVVQGADLASLHPEALFKVAERNQLYILSDDGGKRADGVECGKEPFPSEKKTFRGMAVNY